MSSVQLLRLRGSGLCRLAVGLGLSATTTAIAAQPKPGYVVIVHGSHAGTAIQREQLVSIFLRNVARWGDGTRIRAVDQSTRSAVRERFSRHALGQPTLSVVHYWNGQIQKGGARPPTVKQGDQKVVEFVAKTPGAIGYVSADFALPDGVKALSVTD
jgi:ABC-type phosphate transport system substrate-binding protein